MYFFMIPLFGKINAENQSFEKRPTLKAQSFQMLKNYLLVFAQHYHTSDVKVNILLKNCYYHSFDLYVEIKDVQKASY